MMLQKLSNEIAECYRLAEEARAWALASTDPGMRRDLVLVEQAWLRLARMHEDAEAA
jgi:hypothetical protein